ncbi:MAG: serine/threonine-protein kinase [Mycobacteriales bacterium]
MVTLTPGLALAGRYRLVAEVGAGGMGTVWRADDLVLERPVAVKIPAVSQDPAVQGLFRREATAAARLAHPHITSVFDYGEADVPGGRVAYLVMELLEGESLVSRMSAGPLRWAEAVRTVAEVAEGLAAAHRRGVAHGDVKPANVMLTATGAKVLDFGLAVLWDAPPGGPTLATLRYAAPERLAGAAPSPAADAYALGVVLYEVLTGVPPYPDGYPADPPPGGPPLPGSPLAVADLCRALLSGDPDERPDCARAAEVLREELSGPDTGDLPDEGPPTPTLDDADRDPPGRSKALTRALPVAAAAFVLVLAAVLAWNSGLLDTTRSASPPPPPATRHAVPVPTSTPSASPTPSSSAGPLAALGQFRAVLDGGVTAGQVRPDVANDMNHLVDDLQAQLAGGQYTGVDQQLANLRHKISDRLREHGLSVDSAARLSAALDAVQGSIPAP